MQNQIMVDTLKSVHHYTYVFNWHKYIHSPNLLFHKLLPEIHHSEDYSEFSLREQTKRMLYTNLQSFISIDEA